MCAAAGQRIRVTCASENVRTGGFNPTSRTVYMCLENENTLYTRTSALVKVDVFPNKIIRASLKNAARSPLLLLLSSSQYVRKRSALQFFTSFVPRRIGTRPTIISGIITGTIWPSYARWYLFFLFFFFLLSIFRTIYRFTGVV